MEESNYSRAATDFGSTLLTIYLIQNARLGRVQFLNNSQSLINTHGSTAAQFSADIVEHIQSMPLRIIPDMACVDSSR
jgi:hypothetical protein